MDKFKLQENFFKNKRVLITGHTGFKGSWLTIWLKMMGAQITGISLAPEKDSIYHKINNIEGINSIIQDIRDLKKLIDVFRETKPEIVIHLAAFGFVNEAYKEPLKAFSVNVEGSINIMEAARIVGGVKSIVMVTTDKVYKNESIDKSYSEIDSIGGSIEAYSASKVCVEVAVESYRSSYFNDIEMPFIATARASNVLGGGDHISSRLVPSILNNLLTEEKMLIRNPDSVRPWQNVLDALCGYITLAQNLYNHGDIFSGVWNFGPEKSGIQTVSWLIDKFSEIWGSDLKYEIVPTIETKEFGLLQLDITKSKNSLGWKPIKSLEETIYDTIYFYKENTMGKAVLSICEEQIDSYMKLLFYKSIKEI